MSTALGTRHCATEFSRPRALFPRVLAPPCWRAIPGRAVRIWPMFRAMVRVRARTPRGYKSVRKGFPSSTKTVPIFVSVIPGFLPNTPADFVTHAAFSAWRKNGILVIFRGFLELRPPEYCVYSGNRSERVYSCVRSTLVHFAHSLSSKSFENHPKYAQ